jgi:WD40 repeat protein
MFANLDSTGEITLWQILSGKMPRKVLTLYDMASAFELIEAPGLPFNSRFVVGTHHGELKVIDSQGRQICFGKDHTGADITDIVYDPESNVIVTGSVDGSINVWDMSCALKKEKVFAHGRMLTGLRLITGAKRVLSSSLDGTIFGLDMSTLTPLGSARLVPEGNSFKGGLRSLEISNDGQRTAIAFADQITIFQTSALLAELGKPHSAQPIATLANATYVNKNTLKFVPGNQDVIFGDFFEMRLWSGQPGATYRAILHEIDSDETPDAIEFFVDGLTVITAFSNRPPKIWRLGYAQETPPIRIDEHRISGLSISRSNDMVASSERGAIRVFTADGLITRKGADIKDLTFSVGLSGDKTHVVRGGQGLIEAISLIDGSSKIWPMSEYNNQTGNIKFIPGDDRFVATSSFGTLRSYSLGADEPVFAVPLRPKGGTPMDVAISPSGALVAVAMSEDIYRTSKSRLQIFQSDGKLINEIIEPHGDDLVEGVSFSRDGKLLVSFSLQGQIRVWSSETGAPDGAPITTAGFNKPIGVRFINGDQSLLAVFKDGSVRVIGRKPNADGGWLLYESPKRDEFNLADTTSHMELSADESLLLTGSEHGAVTIWRLGLAPLFSWPQLTIETMSPSLFSTGLPPLACGSVEDIERCWDPVSGIFTIAPPSELGTPIAGSVHGARRLIAQSHATGVVSIAKIGQNREIKIVHLNGGSGWIRWSIDGSRLFLVPASDNGAIHVADVPPDYRLASATPPKDLPGRISSLTPLSGGGVAVEVGTSISIFDAALAQRDRFDLPSDCGRSSRFQPMIFSKDNSVVAIACDDVILLMEKALSGWQARFQKRIWSTTSALHFGLGDKFLISGHASSEINVWNTKTGDEIRNISFGRKIARLDSVGDTLIASSIDGRQRYFSLQDGRALGLSVFSPEGITTLAAEGWFSRVGSDSPPVIGLDGEQELNDELAAKYLSTDLVAASLFYRENYLVQVSKALLSIAKEIWQYINAQSIYTKIGMAAAVSYGVFVFGVVLAWLFLPGLLCSWSLWLSKREALESTTRL